MSRKVLHGYWHEKLDHGCSLTLSCPTSERKSSCLTTTIPRLPTSLSFLCMSYCLNCVPACCRQQVFEHPFTEDPNNEDNFIEVDTRPPLVICLSGLYLRLVLAWDNIWDNSNWVLTKSIPLEPVSSARVYQDQSWTCHCSPSHILYTCKLLYLRTVSCALYLLILLLLC